MTDPRTELDVVGPRVRALRRRRAMTLAEPATAADTSASTLLHVSVG
jgi:hypothetical protein